MQSIGERLEEARKRKGISLREAAEATKIRSDFLASIEQNRFDFELPDIYKRGFLKNYARYLKLDPDKILADYNAHQLSNTRLGKKGGSEWFGQMEVKSPARELTTEEADSTEEHSYGRLAPKAPAAPREPMAGSNEDDEESLNGDENEKVFYIKAGLVCVGVLLLVFVIFGLIQVVLSGDDPDESPVDPEIREEQAGSGTTPPPPPPINTDPNVFTLNATGNVYVLVRQKSDNQELYRETMSAGETITLEKNGPVDILFTAGENIEIQHEGEWLRPSSSGTAKISLP